MNQVNAVKIAVMLGLVGTAAGIAGAQTQHPVNITGATLFENFFAAPQSTIDAIDANANGSSRLFPGNGSPEQLAPTGLNLSTGHWALQYRSVGSGNGLAEMVNWSTRFSVSPLDLAQTATAGLEQAYLNRTKYFNTVAPGTGPVAGLFNAGNPGGAPFRSDLTTLLATYAAPDSPSAGGVRIDAAIMDVPTTWFVTQAGTPSPDATPTATGYGNNAKLAKNKDGSATTQNNKLKSLRSTDNTITLNLNTAAPNAFTVFDAPIAAAPIAFMANYGTGHQQMTYTQLRHLFATGRLPSGENLTVITRDSGSGTRNGGANSLGLDPSFAVGENVGVKNDDAAGVPSSDRSLAGPNFLPSNKGGSGSLERTVKNTRLGIGTTGAERGRGTSGWLSQHQTELLGVKNDLGGGTVFARPTITNLLDNSLNGYNIQGPETFASVGDPKANGAANGGTGWVGAFDPFVDGSNGFPQDGAYQVGESYTDINGNGLRDATNAEAGMTNTNPAMRSAYGAQYINNITRSIDSFVTFGPNSADFTPGEYLAQSFILVAATDNVPNPLDPKALIPNPSFNQALQDQIRSANIVYNDAIYSAYNNTLNGIVPTRTPLTVGTYTDGSTQAYRQLNGGTIALATAQIPARNRIAGDFNGDGVRNSGDLCQMSTAFTQGSAWAAPDGIYGAGAGGTVALDLLGDFNTDGNFTIADVRYFVDGLALNGSGTLDRAAAFTSLDSCFGGNFFSTTLAHGTYTFGASRADIAGAIGVTPGFAPVGNDGRVDAKDIDSIYTQFRGLADHAMNWSDLGDAANGDLSADMTGDLIVDQADITAVLSILSTSMGDVNLDGVVDGTDCSIASANLGLAGLGWAGGDVDGDGTVTSADLALICPPSCDPDVNQDGNVDQDDVGYLINVIGGGENTTGIDPDFNQDGNVDQDDVGALINTIGGGGCP